MLIPDALALPYLFGELALSGFGAEFSLFPCGFCGFSPSNLAIKTWPALFVKNLLQLAKKKRRGKLLIRH